MKVCSKCGLSKSISDFYNHKQNADGHSGSCKECDKKSTKENLKRVGMLYDFSEKGIIRVLYKTQKRHNKLRGHGEMPYQKHELSSWLYANRFKELYDAWVLSGHKKELKPSVDRIDDFNGYSFDNIRLGTWAENKSHQASDRTNGNGTSGRICKRVLKMDSNKTPVCEYVSYWSAVRDIGYSIEYQIKKGVKCRSGFFWKYI